MNNENRPSSCIRSLASDMEVHLRAIAIDHLAHNEDIPEWIWDELAWALEAQCSTTRIER